MAVASLNGPSLPVALEIVLSAFLAPLEAEGAGVIDLGGGDGNPVTLYATGDDPPALRTATGLLLAGSRGPFHAVCPDRRPVLAGPWQVAPAQRMVLVFWRGIDAMPWKKSDHRLVMIVSLALGALLKNRSPGQNQARGVADLGTGLPKARKFVSDLGRHFARLDREGLPGTMMVVSIDGFTGLSAQLGRKGIAAFVPQIADLLNRISRPTDVVARIHGDEFAVWLDGADHFTAAERAEQLRVEAAATLEVEGTPVSLSIGIAARRPGSAQTADALLHRADFALHEAKKAGPGLWRVSHEGSG
jgi:diguanylate cyclase (GGDEF)-like protein